MDTTSKINKKSKFAVFKAFLIKNFVLLNGVVSIIILGMIMALLLYNSIKFFIGYSPLDFFGGLKWSPTHSTPKFGFVPLLTGSMLTTFAAIIIAIPLGIGSALYIGELAPKVVREILKPVIEILATIPSVVIGFIGLKIAAPLLKNIFNLSIGQTALTGAVMLAFMSLPTIISISEDAINAVPNRYRHASLALGATKWETTYKIVVPTASSGMVAAVMLGLGRIVGETMAVLMLTGNSPRIVLSLLQPIRTITATIAAEMGETAQGGLHYTALFAIGFILFLITFLINFVGDSFTRRIKNM